MNMLDKLEALMKAGLPRMVYVSAISDEQREMLLASYAARPSGAAERRAGGRKR